MSTIHTPLAGSGAFRYGSWWIPYVMGFPIHHPDGTPQTCATEDSALRIAGVDGPHGRRRGASRARGRRLHGRRSDHGRRPGIAAP